MIFYDTGAWVALSVPGDRNAKAARALQAEVGQGAHGAILTTDYVLDEAATMIRMETDADAASRFLRTVLQGPSVRLVWIDEGHFRSALERLDQRRDKRWSFTDCTSFIVMEELGVRDAFSFDANFEEAGFARRP